MVDFRCGCGQQLSGPAGEIIHCPRCFETVGVPKLMSPKPKPVPQPAPEPEVPPPPMAPPEMKRFANVWVLASALQCLLLASSILCLIATLILIVPQEQKTEYTAMYTLSAAFSGLVALVFLQAAKAILEMADRDEQRK